MTAHPFTLSEVLDPEFCSRLQYDAAYYDVHQSFADQTKWDIAKQVNEWWSEHQGVFEGNKKAYFAEVSRVANIGLEKPRFSQSGETLRKYCELQESYKNVKGADNLLKQTSFDHLMTARKLAKDGKVDSPLKALTEAFQNGWTEEEMRTHFDPPELVHPYDKITGWLASLYDKSNWGWVDRARFEKVKTHLDAISELLKEGTK